MLKGQFQQATSFFHNPFALLRAGYQRLQDENVARKAITQEEYFASMVCWIAHTQSQLLICGYDAPFMELKQTQDAIVNAARGKGYHRRNGGVIISAIMPEGLDCGMLEELADEVASVSILRTDVDLSKGYLIHDLWGVNLWDSIQLTPHPREKYLGVIRRDAFVDDLLVRKIRLHYQELRDEIER